MKNTTKAGQNFQNLTPKTMKKNNFKKINKPNAAFQKLWILRPNSVDKIKRWAKIRPKTMLHGCFSRCKYQNQLHASYNRKVIELNSLFGTLAE